MSVIKRKYENIHKLKVATKAIDELFDDEITEIFTASRQKAVVEQIVNDVLKEKPEYVVMVGYSPVEQLFNEVRNQNLIFKRKSKFNSSF